MPFMLVYSSIKNEQKLLHERFVQYAAYQMTDEWECRCFQAPSALMEELDSSEMPEICCLDISVQGGLDFAKTVRMKLKNGFIVVIADLKMSPLMYIKPTIMAAGILLRPIDHKQADELLSQVFTAIKEREAEEAFSGEMFKLETKESVIRIPFSKILYFEARSKKIFLCMKNSEKGFYATLEALEESLPDKYLRCHKSYIVNTTAIERISFPQNTIYLSGNIEIPISRSYKNAVREGLI